MFGDSNVDFRITAKAPGSAEERRRATFFMQGHLMTAIDSPSCAAIAPAQCPGRRPNGTGASSTDALSSWMWQYALRGATTDHKTTTLSSMHDDATSVILTSVIACLVLAILILRSPEAAQLTPEQINLPPLWGP